MGPMGADGTQFTDTRTLIQPDGAYSVFNSIGTDACGSVVVAGNLPKTAANGQAYSLYAAVIVKRVDAQTRSKTSINDLLRP